MMMKRTALAALLGLCLALPASAVTNNFTVTVTIGGSLPPGVTLTAIDGETMTSSTVMSHTYYSANGFTIAHTAGWDSPSFFPIGAVASGSIDSADVVTQWQQLGWNMHWVEGGSEDLSLIGTNASPPIWGGWDVQNGTPLAGTGAETVLLETYDEPPDFASGITIPLSTTANTYQTGRPWWLNNTWNWIIYGGLSGDPAGINSQDLSHLVTTPSGAGQTTRHINIASIDMYFFSGTLGDINGEIGTVWNLNGNQTDATADQCRRGFLYGDIIDTQRGYQPTYPAPILSYIEDSQPNGSGGVTYTLASYIQPAELNQAVWMSIIHGARAIDYFDDNISGPLTSGSQSNPVSPFPSTEGAFTRTVGCWNSSNFPTGAKNPSGISMCAQIAKTDALVLALAPIINSPIANAPSFNGNYVTVSPASGELQTLPLCPGCNTQNGGGGGAQGNSAFAGVDVRATWYQGGSFTNSYNTTYGGGPTNLTNGFYIIASPRWSETTANGSATFTLADTSATSVTVVGENRTISVSSGVFSDTFASGLTVHVYEVNGP